jgi:hypothetical protein
MQVDYVQGVVSEILTYNVLQKCKLMLDHRLEPEMHGLAWRFFLFMRFSDTGFPTWICSGPIHDLDACCPQQFAGGEVEGNRERIPATFLEAC